MAQYEHLPIYKAAFDLQVYFEGIVKNFSRYHKYTHGSALRDLTHIGTCQVGFLSIQF